jgi:hypothetical protein
LHVLFGYHDTSGGHWRAKAGTVTLGGGEGSAGCTRSGLGLHAVSSSIGSASSASLLQFGFMGLVLLRGLHAIDRFLVVERLGREAGGFGLAAT